MRKYEIEGAYRQPVRSRDVVAALLVGVLVGMATAFMWCGALHG